MLFRCGSCGEHVFLPNNPHCVLLCTECDETIERLRESGEDVYWFTAHVDPTFIVESTHPQVVPLSALPFTDRCDPGDFDSAIVQVARAILRARAVLVVAGAGMSADGGMPTFRGTGGV